MSFTKYTFMVTVLFLFIFIFAAISQDDSSKHWGTLGEKIKNSNSQLIGFFNSSDASGIADLFADNDIVFNAEGKIIRGKENIKNFWEDLIKNKATDLTLKTVNVYINEVSKDNPDNYTHIAYIITEYAYKYQGESISGSYMQVRWHVHNCPWLP
jgi:hypothetical protein